MEPFYWFFFQRSHFIILWLVQSLLRMLREKKFIVDAHKKTVIYTIFTYGRNIFSVNIQ